MATILYITDLYYSAKDRNYCEEDLFITARLRQHFELLIAHPQQATTFLDRGDILVFRNTGSVLNFEEYFKDFLKAVGKNNLVTFNSFDGKADQQGKQYLLDLYALGYPVIPTVEDMADIKELGAAEHYMVKLKNGADSIGMELLSGDELLIEKPVGKLIQPWIDFQYEVSFYYLNNEFQYALYAPDKAKRWELTEYIATPADLEFARKFQIWNNMERGISRVDACRLRDGSLLLVELEDLNPYLSIAVLSEHKRDHFINNLVIALMQLIPENPPIDLLPDRN